MSGYIDYLKELFMPFGEVDFRRMFGAYGVFYQGVMFALVADDVLYLKADKQVVKAFGKKGLASFSYNKQNKIVKLSYYLGIQII